MTTPSRSPPSKTNGLKLAKGSAPATPSRRELNKNDKLRRIKHAARELFIEKNFDEATTREIAQRAGVGMGTIFLYADNKRDLLFLIANDDLASITDQSTSEPPSGERIIDDFMRIFRLHYEFFGAQPELSRSMLREMTFYDSGKQARRFQTIRAHILQYLSAIVEAGRERGVIRRDQDAQFLAWLVFCIYQVELRRWISMGKPELKSGLNRLKSALLILLRGASALVSDEKPALASPSKHRAAHGSAARPALGGNPAPINARPRANGPERTKPDA